MSVPPLKSSHDEVRNPVAAACNALIAHIESQGEEVLEKNLEHLVTKKLVATVWVVTGDGAESFRDMASKWLEEQGYLMHPERHEPI
jgi:hypothetical protein